MSLMKKIIFNNDFYNVKKDKQKISFYHTEQKYEVENNKLSPFNKDVANLLGIENKVSEVKTSNTQKAKISINLADNPFRNIISDGKPLSWTGSAGVDKFISCPRKAFLSSRRQKKIFNPNAEASVEIGTLIHEYTLRHSFSISDARELLSYFLNIHSKKYAKHYGVNIVENVMIARRMLFNAFKEHLGEGYTARFEEMNMATYHGLKFIQYVDAYAMKKDGDKLKVVIVDLKTSSRAEVKEMTYWGQLLYYQYNLRKKLSKEFDIPEENISFQNFILWSFYKTVKGFNYKLKELEKDEGRPIFSSLIRNDIPLKVIFSNTKFFTTLINATYWDKVIIKSYNVFLTAKKDTSKYALTPVILTEEHENYLEEDIKKASEVIYSGNIKPNFHSCNKHSWGCDYESLCHLKTKIAKGMYVDKRHMVVSLFENLDDHIVRKAIPEW